MTYEVALIDKAAHLCGRNYANLSREWGVPESRISEYRKGKRHIPLAKVPKLAVLAGIDPQEAYLRVSIEQMPEGSEERDLLGNARATIAVALLLLCVVPGLLLPSMTYASDMTRYQKDNESIHRGIWGGILAWLRRYVFRLRGLRLSAVRHSVLRHYALSHSTLRHSALRHSTLSHGR